MSDLKPFLESLYSGYNKKEFIESDPIKWAHLCSSSADIEITGFISSLFAYGRVSQINSVLEVLFRRLGKFPSETLGNSSDQFLQTITSQISYRFYTDQDIRILLVFLRTVLQERGSLKPLFSASESEISYKNLFLNWTLFCQCAPNAGGGLNFMIPNPSKKSASKRMAMFLRWMVRKDAIDFGIWSDLGADRLVIPMDTHVSRVSYYLGLSDSPSATLLNARKVTQSLKKICPSDPVKYDFCISRLGILNECPTRKDQVKCANCQLLQVCRR
ncbi:MAG: TIGR02757 family protein [Bacteroidetes bacterium]|nr:TIGR02757 family protein [Bacteroidota bacterium]